MLPIVSLVIYLAILGFLVWVLITYIPMPEPFKRVIILVVIVLVLLWLVRTAGLF